MNIFLGIDGTDNLDTTADPIGCMPLEAIGSKKSGHVKRMMNLGFGRAKYFPGTTDSISGKSSSDIIESALAWIKQAYGEGKDPGRRLFLSGFSRGGAAIIVIAHKLAKLGIPVQEMFIFDAVDRSFWMDNSLTQSIPKNVVRAFHAIRDPRAGSRRSFGNCGMQSAHGNLQTAPFFTTHGGVGGWPNGKEKVTPGFGVEDFAYVATFGAVVAPGVVALDPNQNNIHETGEAWPSRVSPAAELQGAKEAMRWMYGKGFSTVGAGY